MAAARTGGEGGEQGSVGKTADEDAGRRMQTVGGRTSEAAEGTGGTTGVEGLGIYAGAKKRGELHSGVCEQQEKDLKDGCT